MIQPQLSILIPAIPSRFAKAEKLYARILQLIGARNIEVLLLMDNKVRSIGLKREDIKNACRGKYFMFVDDDDDLLSIEGVYQATFQDVDVITFKQRCLNKDKSTYIVTFGLGNEVEHNVVNGIYKDIKRPPWHVCAWHEQFKAYHYPDISYSEDWEWLKQVLPLAMTEIHIDEVVHSYNWDPITSEASMLSNEFWKNPNVGKPSNPCIVSLSCGGDRYLAGHERLAASLHHSGIANSRLFVGVNSVGAPFHADNPYAFKIYALQAAHDQGYNPLLWTDASLVAVKPAKPVFDWLIDKGIFLEEAGHLVGIWCNQYTLDYFKITRAEAMKMSMFAAGYCGFDFRNPISIEFFARWKEAMLNGCFRGSWDDHRHDMTCGSIIANQMGLVGKYSPAGQFFAYIGPGYAAPKESAVFHLLGL
jgi:hypothetical protein